MATPSPPRPLSAEYRSASVVQTAKTVVRGVPLGQQAPPGRGRRRNDVWQLHTRNAGRMVRRQTSLTHDPSHGLFQRTVLPNQRLAAVRQHVASEVSLPHVFSAELVALGTGAVPAQRLFVRNVQVEEGAGARVVAA